MNKNRREKRGTENRFFIFNREVTPEVRRKRFLRWLQRKYYSLVFSGRRPVDTRKLPYYVSLVTIFKNEAPYLKEWIEFHRIVGVDHFFLYNNHSEDDYLSILKPYVDQGLVTLRDWDKDHAQMECYHDAIGRYRDQTRWMGFIDLDEFVVPNDTDSFGDFLKGMEGYPSVLFYWKMFGTSGRMDRDRKELVTEDFTVAWRKYDNVGKCFYNTCYDFDSSYKRNGNLHHWFWGSRNGKGLPPVNVFGKPVVSGDYNPVPGNADPAHFPVQINHYFTKSYQEYLDKKSKGDVRFAQNPHNMEYFFQHEKLCQSVDYHAYKYLIQLKAAMKESIST